MPNLRFHHRSTGFSVADLAKDFQVPFSPAELGSRKIIDVAPLDQAKKGNIAVFNNQKYLSQVPLTQAGCIIIEDRFKQYVPENTAAIITRQPYLLYAKIAAKFYPTPEVDAQISPHAHVSENAIIGEGCRIDAGVVIEVDVELGENVWVQANAVITENVKVGHDSIIGPNVTISHSILGHHVRILAGARLGTRGFGFTPEITAEGVYMIDIPQLGGVVIGDYVEIGANTTIDRGSSSDTVIGDHCRIDNLVQIGHNVKMGSHCIIVAQVGIAGSAVIEPEVQIGGQVGIAGHLNIGSGSRIAAQSGVIRDLPPKSSVVGSPAIPSRLFFKIHKKLLDLVGLKGLE